MNPVRPQTARHMGDVMQICVPLLIVLLIAVVGERVCNPLRGERHAPLPNALPPIH